MFEETTLAPVEAPPLIEPDPASVLDQLAPRISLLQTEIARVIIGQEEIIAAILYALFARGHCLLQEQRALDDGAKHVVCLPPRLIDAPE